ncbi:hypothetical protein LTR09_006269 [Extremus antarcticus]|uniref:Sugar phosphate transporter domain-containing protein n=1 Tax=Extremus antarcticus TaxID=702011 RepID=A0AAJ0DM28_9PEZI|nr:hypothetical protein LTR09_006269 [Extremus antarcticus]
MEAGAANRGHSNTIQRHSSDSSYNEERERLTSDDSLEMEDYMRTEDEEEASLTNGRRKQQSREEGPDEQPSMRNPNASEPTKRMNPSTIRGATINGILIVLWYSFSISISVYNKWMFSAENLDFHYPLFVTSLHMLVQFSLASGVLYFIPRFRPGADPTINPHNPTYRQLDGSDDIETTLDRDDATSNPASKKPLMTKTFYATRITPCGTATALDIGLGNFSLRFISLTFFTMCKSSVLIFVLAFAFVFRLESPTWRLCVIILFMTAGVVMMVAGETAFSALGFVLVMTASLCSGFRWSLTQIMLLRNPATSNPFSSIFFLTPVMFVALFALALPIEGPANVIVGIKELSASHGGFYSFVLLLFPGILAFLMVSAEFALLKRTSVVTLSVCGIFKEVLTISAAGIAFGDELSPINVSGLVVTILSIAAYNVLKYTKMRSDSTKAAHETAHTIPDLGPQQMKVERGVESRGVVDSTSALLRRDSEQFALAGDDDDRDFEHPSFANGVEDDRLDKTGPAR